MNFKPMLSASLDGVDLNTLPYPLVVSPKLDGLRCILWKGVAYSRNAKPFRNHFLQAWAKAYHNLDGEIIVGSPTDGLVLERSKAITAFEGEPDFAFHLFDTPVDPVPFNTRLFNFSGRYAKSPRIQVVDQFYTPNIKALLAWEQYWLAQGYEGLMARRPDGPYKNGRSTLREGYLMKLKRFTDGEAKVVGFEEAMENTNELQRDELGRAKRSHHQAGKLGKGMVGVLVCEDHTWGLIRVSPGIMTHHQRQQQWELVKTNASIIGQTIHWRSFGYGTKDAPRFARYYGVRE